MNTMMLKALVALQAHQFNAKKQKGQGVIEYAGALVIAAVLVSAVLAIGPDGIKTLFTDILSSVTTYFKGELPGAA